jgi:hypothetical protein
MAIADFNRDGKVDVAVANYGHNTGDPMTSTPGSVTIALGDGTGGFSNPPLQIAIGQSNLADPDFIYAADFNNDGNPDVVINDQDDGSVVTLLGKGDGTFQSQVTWSSLPLPAALAVGDVNGGGLVDIVTANISGSPSPFVGVLLNEAQLSSTCQTSSLALGPHAITATYPGDTYFASGTSSVAVTVDGGCH